MQRIVILFSVLVFGAFMANANMTSTTSGCIGETSISSKSTIPVTQEITMFKVVRYGNEVELYWEVKNEDPWVQYNVLRSIDGLVFETFTSLHKDDPESFNLSSYSIIDDSKNNQSYLFYQVVSVNSEEVENKSKIIHVLPDSELDIDILLFPNPVSKNLSVSASKSFSHIQLLDMGGNEVMISNVDATNSARVDVSKLTPGLYMVNVSGTDFVQGKQIMINQ